MKQLQHSYKLANIHDQQTQHKCKENETKGADAETKEKKKVPIITP